MERAARQTIVPPMDTDPALTVGCGRCDARIILPHSSAAAVPGLIDAFGWKACAGYALCPRCRLKPGDPRVEQRLRAVGAS